MADSEANNTSSSRLDILVETKSLLASYVSQIPLELGVYFDKPGFLDRLPASLLEFTNKLVKAEPNPNQAGNFSMRGEQEWMSAMRFNSTESLSNAIALGALAVKFIHRDDPNRGLILSAFGRTLRYQWRLSGDIQQLDETIYFFRKAVELEPEDEPNRAVHLNDFGNALYERYKQSHQPEDYEDGVKALEGAVAIPDSAKPWFLCSLGRLVKERAIQLETGVEASLDESINIHLKALKAISAEFRGSVQSLYRNLAEAYYHRYGLDPADPVQGIQEVVKKVVDETGNMWMFKYEMALVVQDIVPIYGRLTVPKRELILPLLRSALEDSPENLTVMCVLTDTLEDEGHENRSITTLTDALHYAEKVLAATPQYASTLPIRTRKVSVILTLRFEYTQDSSDIERAITMMNHALALPQLDQQDRRKYVEILGVQLIHRFNLLQKVEDLEQACSNLKSACEADGLSGEEYAHSLREYGRALFAKSRMRPQESQIDAAIECFTKSISLWSAQNSIIASCYHDLGNAHLLKFESEGKLDDIRTATDFYLKALACVQQFPLLKADTPLYIMGLANAFFAQYEKWNQMTDLDQAISHYQKSIEETSDSDYLIATRAASLGWALQAKFNVTRNKKYLDLALNSITETLERDIAMRPQDTAFLLMRLGAAYIWSFHASDDVTFLDKAIATLKKVPKTGCTMPEILNPASMALTRALMCKYEKTQKDEDLQAASAGVVRDISASRTSNSRESRGLLSSAADFLAMLFDSKGNKPYGLMANITFIMLSRDQTALPQDRVHAAMQAGRLQYEINNNAKAARDHLALAVNLLPEAILVSSNRGDQLRAARHLGWLPSHIISFCLAAGDPPSEIVQFYERGRSVIWNRLLDQKTEHPELREKHPELAVKFEHLRDQLGKPNSISQGIVPEIIGRSRIGQLDAAMEYNAAVAEIRKLEGFQQFLSLPNDRVQIQQYGSQGPVVILNATKYRSDAIIITSESVFSISLPLFTAVGCMAKTQQLQSAISVAAHDPQQSSKSFEEVMQWLWRSAAQPVLDALSLTGHPADNGKLPRIWWLASGWISALPIHAAGDHKRALETGEPCSVMDRVVSSYVPTLRALSFARANALVPQISSKSAILVQMPTTPNDLDLTNVSKEVEVIEQILAPRFQVTNLQKPRRAHILPLLNVCTMAHFACHGSAEEDDPSSSLLKLQDWRAAPLDVRALIRTSMPHCQFVYLSACETAVNRIVKLREEVVHLSSAFHMAGVPYTVATLWNIEDSFSVDVANEFYNELVPASDEPQPSLPDFGNTSRALHASTMKARNREVDALLWAAYVHYGA